MSQSPSKLPIALLGCGGLLLFASVVTCLFSGFHVFLDPEGGISDREAMPGLIGGVFCSIVNLVIVVAGAALNSRKPSSTVVQAGLAPGAPPSAAPAGPAAKPKPFPAHLLGGCASLFLLLVSCSMFGGIYYFMDQADRAHRYYEEDLARQRQQAAGGYGGYLDPDFWRRREDEHQQYAMGSGCCGVFALALVAGAGFGTLRLKRKYDAASAVS